MTLALVFLVLLSFTARGTQAAGKVQISFQFFYCTLRTAKNYLERSFNPESLFSTESLLLTVRPLLQDLNCTVNEQRLSQTNVKLKKNYFNFRQRLTSIFSTEKLHPLCWIIDGIIVVLKLRNHQIIGIQRKENINKNLQGIFKGNQL